MKKRVLSLVMSTAMVASVLTACGSSNTTETPAADTTTTETKTEAAATTTEAAATEEVTDYGTGEIKVWVAENVQTFTQDQIKSFQVLILSTLVTQ